MCDDAQAGRVTEIDDLCGAVMRPGASHAVATPVNTKVRELAEIHVGGGPHCNALSLLAPANVKVVILGQDPYPTAGNAHGLAFSVTRQTKLPGSLRNIFTELANDLGVPPPAHGDLTDWAHQGVLLLNTVLTVEEGRAHAYKNWGWEKVTDAIIAALARDYDGLVFILWGGYAQKKSPLIDPARHLIIKEVHPSGLSVYRGFWGSKPFSKTNAYLLAQGKGPVQWA